MTEVKDLTNLENYNHKISEKVKFHEVDMLGVCNNAVYFNYFEDARIEYLRNLHSIYNFQEFLIGDSFFIMVRNECNYRTSAYLDDELSIYTKVSFAKKTSFGFSHLVYRESTGEIIAEGAGVVVHIDKIKKIPLPLPKEFYLAVENFEQFIKIIKVEK